MQQRLELLLRRGVRKHELAHALAVESAAGIEEFVAEFPRDRARAAPTRRGQLVRDGVGVDDCRAELGRISATLLLPLPMPPVSAITSAMRHNVRR